MWHCHIDDAGGVRLYTEFEDAINGGFDNALPLVLPTETKQILVRSRNVLPLFGACSMGNHNQSHPGRHHRLGEEFVSQYTRG